MPANTTPAPPAWDVVALGEAMVEFNQTNPGQPQYLQGFGGDTSNAAIAAARAGASTAYLTRLGADAFGDALAQLWKHEEVDTGGLERDPQRPTGVYFVTHGPQGHQFSYLRSGSAASAMTPDWLQQPQVQARLRNTAILHVSGISMAISTSACDTVLEAMHQARNAGVMVAFDPNLRLRLWPLARARACIGEALSLCHVFLPGTEDLHSLTGLDDAHAMADWCHDKGAANVVLKQGSEGAMVSGNTGRTTIPARCATLVDATGAGDCFDGNLLARMAAGDTLEAAARYANQAAALAVQGFGAVAPLPTETQVRAALQAG